MFSAAEITISGWLPAVSPGGSRGNRPSLLAAEILRCADGAQVLRVGAATQLPFSEAVARLGNGFGTRQSSGNPSNSLVNLRGHRNRFVEK